MGRLSSLYEIGPILGQHPVLVLLLSQLRQFGSVDAIPDNRKHQRFPVWGELHVVGDVVTDDRTLRYRADQGSSTSTSSPASTDT